ncbi:MULTISPECIES: RHS repeat-associated core domain-containing protein [unclassified Shewanella]|uniref:RHS repeat-associated core domain-containing protein n=1 Tax=unclassified Shewanella TaxID=196818 RepID=UPI00354EDB6F
MSNFRFNGQNRHIVVALTSASTPAGFQLLTFDKANQLTDVINEISPHLVRDRNALIYGRDLVLQAGLSATLQPRNIVKNLTEAIERSLLRVYVEVPKPQIQYSTETATPGVSSSAKKTPKSNNGKKASSAASAGSVTNNTSTEVAIDKQECRSDPVSMLSGEEILPLVDFEISGLLPLTWRRLYRSSKIDSNIGLGFGWRHNFSVQLTHQYKEAPKIGPKKPAKQWYELTDEEGRVHVFDCVKRGQTSIQTSTGWSLVHQADGRQVLIKPDESHWAFKLYEIEGKTVWLLETISNHQGQYFELYYDKKGRLAQITTGPKRGVLLHYNAQNNLLRVSSYVLNDKGNREVHPSLLASYQYDDAEALIAATDINGLVERYSYVDAAKPKTQAEPHKHPLGPKSSTYLLKRRTRASGYSHHFAWDSHNASAKCIEQWGDNDTYHYHFAYEQQSSGMRSSCVDSLGNKEEFVHNAQGLLTEYHNANGHITRHQYDAAGRKVATIDANHNQTQYLYNSLGQIDSIVQPDGGVTSFEYNRLGQRILTQDPMGRKLSKQFDATGRILSEINFDGRQRQYQYNDFGQVTQKIEFDGVTHKYLWDRDGELLATQVGESLTRYSHDRLGRVNAVIDPQGLVTEFIRDDKGQVVQQKSYPQSAPEESINKYFQFDDAGRLTCHSQDVSQLDINADEITSTNTDVLDNKSDESSLNHTMLSYQGLSQPSEQTFADGSWLKFHYDKERNLKRIARSDGSEYAIDYTPTEQPKKLVGFDGREQQYQYDANDKLIAVNDSDTRFIELSRDAMGRIVKQSSHVKIEANALSPLLNTQNFYQYDKLGQITRAHNQHRTVEQKYDVQGRLATSTQGSWQLEYQYNDKGQRRHLVLPDGSNIGYQYNANGQLTDISLQTAVDGAQTAVDAAVARPDKQTLNTLVSYQYLPSGLLHKSQQSNQLELVQEFDAFSRLSAQTWSNQCDATTFEYRQYQYDKQDQLNQLSTELAAQQPRVKQFTYNRISQLVKDVTACMGESFTAVHESAGHEISADDNSAFDNSVFDDREQIVRPLAGIKSGSGTHQYQWDAFGNPQTAIGTHAVNNVAVNNATDNNRTDKKSTENSPAELTVNTPFDEVIVKNDRLLSMAGIDYRYDASGNQINQLAKGDKQQRSFNGLNQLVHINVNGRLAQYEYDALGRRSSKITEQGRTDFIWDNNQLIGECSLGEYTWYIYQPETFLPVALVKHGQIYHYHLDQLGTPICLTDVNAQTVWRNHLDVFGHVDSTHIENSAEVANHIDNLLRFQGQYFDDESGLHYNRFRYYSPEQARFIHQDPIGLVGGINHYQYAPNHVNWVDPFGLLCKEGEEKLERMLGTLVNDTGIDTATKDKILQAAITSAALAGDPNAYVKYTKPGGKNKLDYQYDITGLDEDAGTITISKEIEGANSVREVTLTVEEFAGGHLVDGKLVNEDWAKKGSFVQEKDIPLNKAKKKDETQTYKLTDKQQKELEECCQQRDAEMTKRDEFDRGTPEYNKQIPPINHQSAKIGEKAADMAVKDKYPGFERIHPDDLDNSSSVSGNFDMVYQNANGDVIIVEAKGGKSPLGKKKIDDEYHQQGTTKYAQAITASMEGNKNANAVTDRKAAVAIKEAAEDGSKVQYLHIETPITKTAAGSTVNDVSISEFDIDTTQLVG